MARRKAANLLKGAAWLLLAAAVLPTFSTSEGPAEEVTELTVGLPWSPWLVYRESWSSPSPSQAPVFSYATAIEPRCWSTALLLAGAALIVISRIMKASGKTAPSPMSVPRTRSRALGT
jgi:hypothetical protein